MTEKNVCAEVVEPLVKLVKPGPEGKAGRTVTNTLICTPGATTRVNVCAGVVEPLVKLVRPWAEGKAGRDSNSLAFCSLPSACLAKKQGVCVCRPPVKLAHGQAYLLLWFICIPGTISTRGYVS